MAHRVSNAWGERHLAVLTCIARGDAGHTDSIDLLGEPVVDVSDVVASPFDSGETKYFYRSVVAA